MFVSVNTVDNLLLCSVRSITFFTASIIYSTSRCLFLTHFTKMLNDLFIF